MNFILPVNIIGLLKKHGGSIDICHWTHPNYNFDEIQIFPGDTATPAEIDFVFKNFNDTKNCRFPLNSVSIKNIINYCFNGILPGNIDFDEETDNTGF